MGNFSVVGQKLDGYVNNQIYQRQKIHGKSLRNDSDIQFLSNRNAWLKLARHFLLLTLKQPFQYIRNKKTYNRSNNSHNNSKKHIV